MSMEDYFFEEKPIQLIDFKGENFELNKTAFEYLSKIKEDIIIISVVGKARTGKSYLMNLLLDNVGKSSSFEVASSITSCTKGIWIWGNYRKKPNNNSKILFIDSEGTCSIDRSTKTYDSKIFALIVLISSLFIYNTTSVIDENGIGELALAAHLSGSIATNAGINKDDLINELSPKFIWLIRDFTLNKVHPETGEPIDGKEYLDICLRKKISGKNSEENNMIRENIVKHFKDRDCLTLIRPLDDENDLKNLNKFTVGDLKTDFRNEFMILKNKVYSESQPKRVNGKKLNGPTLANLISEFIKAINSGAVPNINNVWDTVVEKDINDFFNKSLNHYKEKSQGFIDFKGKRSDILRGLLSVKNQSILIYENCRQLNEEIVRNNSYKTLFEKTRVKLEEKIKEFEKKVMEEKTEYDKKANLDVLKNKFQEIQKKILNNSYSIMNANDYLLDFESLFSEYFAKKQGNNSLETFTNFFTEKYPLIIKNFIKRLESENKDILSALIQTQAKLLASFEVHENENKNLKQKDIEIKKNLKLLQEEFEKKKLIHEDCSKNVSELKIEIHNKKVLLSKTEKLNQSNNQTQRELLLNQNDKLSKEKNSFNGDQSPFRRDNSELKSSLVLYENENSAKNCDCNCSII